MAVSEAEWARRAAVLESIHARARELSEENDRLRERLKALEESRDDRLDVMRAALVRLARLVIGPPHRHARKFALEVIAEHGDGS